MKLLKLKKVYRIFFPRRFTNSELFENKLKKNSEIVSFERKGALYELVLKNGIRLIVRNENYSDYLVLQQIFGFEEYKIVLGLINLNQLSSQPKIIIDAGANVGYTTVFFSHNLESSKIYSIEPSTENAKIFLKNISFLENNQNIHLYQKALSHQAGMTYTIDRDFRDGKDWAIATKPDTFGEVLGISLDEIIKDQNLQYITLLKIDIEGSERFIFDSQNNLSFLNITQILAIEIHDEYKMRDSIYELLKNNNFILFESRELTIGINKKFFCD
jgi:FkbM family methyltransferase